MYNSNLFHLYLISKYYIPDHKIKPVPDATTPLFRGRTETEREEHHILVMFNISLGFYLVQPSHFWGLSSGAMYYI